MSRALLIDFDGVLRHRDPEIAARCERQAGLPAGSLLATAFRPELLTAAATGEITQREWQDRIAHALTERFPGADVTAAVAECFGHVGYIDEEVLAIVDAVRPHATVCLISNATDRLHRDLAALGIADRFEHAVASADLGVTKPDPRVFAALARLAGAPAKRCLMVDDTPANTEAARRAGMTGHTFTSAANLKDAVDDWLDKDLVTMAAQEVDRKAVRVLCLDPQDRLLLMHWHDPVSGDHFWEPTGGGVEPGESTSAAARREVLEETGLLDIDLDEEGVPVRRDYMWRGKWFRSHEEFFVARVRAGHATAETALTESEVETLLDIRWWTWPELLGSTERIEPADIVPVLRRLAPDGPWRSVTRVSDTFKTGEAQ
ncbi:HAD-IA family hydrolase [Kibdelosporangium phytohabitans]|uniref:Nudix hydrolase domain-containing protein n=1 Tax=Kibdelosporangium phytohabitans TaxID=860235 RepID=A0A0N9HYP7_9PSEU|nr:HAD-IA family hydrolase [Kibdelosporangium phytohabitans]ALG08841.1 hypothetical protein AOZ06_19705 [Kibdelosporangium phytohabitans]MBE1470013.1 HAD superfamily hydrolase (TIGR01509 family) [Kibdelosporangium phytohabitans]